MKKALIIIGVIVLFLALFVVKTLWNAGNFKTITSYCECACDKVPGFVGAEDITIDQETGTAYISCSDRRAAMRGEKAFGAIYAYSLKEKNPRPVNLTRGLKREFHPHGISLYKTPQGEKLLFVIAMGHDAHFHETTKKSFVEIYELAGDRLLYRETLESDLMTSPNDILAVGPRQFYVSNDHGATSPLGKTLENYLQLAISYVVYYDGKEFKNVAGDMAYTNGVNMSADGGTVYVAATVGRLVRVYKRDKATGDLEKLEDIDLNTGADNIEMDAQGNLYVGCHPKLLAFVKHSKDPAALSPSHIVKISREGSAWTVKDVYMNTGEEVSGSSVGAVYGKTMLIGSVYEGHILRCTLK